MPDIDEDGIDLNIIYASSPELRVLYSKAMSDADAAVKKEADKLRAALTASLDALESRDFAAEFNERIAAERAALDAEFKAMRQSLTERVKPVRDALENSRGDANAIGQAAKGLADRADALKSELDAVEAKLKAFGETAGKFGVNAVKKLLTGGIA